MGRANCCNICTPPPESCVLGACCHDSDGDNIEITCEENVTESYCLVKPNSVFNAHGICGEKIACDGYYVPKISRLGANSFIVIKSDGSVATWLTHSQTHVNYIDKSLMVSSQNAQRIQPKPFGDNGAVKIYSNNVNFCAVQKKDGSYVAWGASINSQTATLIEADLLNCRKIVSSFSHLCILKEDKTISMHYIGNTSPPSLPIIPPNLEALLVHVKDVFCPEITTENQYENKFCFQLENDDCYTIGIYDHLYDCNRDGSVSSADLLQITNHINTAPYYNNVYDINTNGSVTASDQNALFNYIATYGSSSSATENGEQRPISNVSGVFVGANNFHFIKHDGSFYSTLNTGASQDELTSVKELAFTDKAVCALNHDGTVVAWGLTSHGGLIPPDLKQELNNLPSCYPRKLASTNSAFCVVVANPGFPYSEDCPSPTQISPSNGLFTWGERLAGGSTETVFTGNPYSDPYVSSNGRYQLPIWYVTPDFSIIGGNDIFLLNGGLLAWGLTSHGGLIPSDLKQELNNLPSCYPRKLASTNAAFCVVVANPGYPYSEDCPSPTQISTSNGLFTWGEPLAGGSTETVFTGNPYSDPYVSSNGRYELPIWNVTPDVSIIGGNDIFILNGELTWGIRYNIYYYSDPYGPEAYYDSLFQMGSLVDIKFTTGIAQHSAYCLLTQDSQNEGYKVISVGDIFYGGYGTTSRYDATKNTPVRRYRVVEVVSNQNSFAAITTEGTIICWGHARKIDDQVHQTFIDSELEKIGYNVNLHNNLTTIGYEGCFSDTAQKNYCKTEEHKRPDCNVFTGECDYDLGNFYPFNKVDSCEECHNMPTYYQPVITSNSFILNDYTPEDPACFRKAIVNYVYQPFTFGETYVQDVTEDYCENYAFNGIGGVFTRTPEVGIEPSGSCCVGLICEEGFNEFAPNPFSDKCKDLKVCYDEITEGQCYDQRFRLGRGNDIWNEFKMYYHFEKDKQCSQRIGEQGC